MYVQWYKSHGPHLLVEYVTNVLLGEYSSAALWNKFVKRIYRHIFYLEAEVCFIHDTESVLQSVGVL